jgi:hypothetical protein
LAERRREPVYAMGNPYQRAFDTMVILQILLVIAAFAAVTLLLLHQMATQVREYCFYRARGWDFSVDSGLDRLKLDQRILIFDLGLSSRQRLYLFRPFYIAGLILFIGLMISSLF